MSQPSLSESATEPHDTSNHLFYTAPSPAGPLRKLSEVNMFICYFINSVSGSVALQYSCSNECNLIQEFKEDENVPSCEVMSVEAEVEEYFTEDAYQDLAKHLWAQLADVSTDDDGVDGRIDEVFLHFPKGTLVRNIWQWLEREFDVSVAKDLMGV